MCMGYHKFGLLVLKVILRSPGALVLKWPVTPAHKAKRVNFETRGNSGPYTGYIWPSVLKVIWGTFGAIACTWLVVRFWYWIMRQNAF